MWILQNVRRYKYKKKMNVNGNLKGPLKYLWWQHNLNNNNNKSHKFFGYVYVHVHLSKDK